MDEAMLYRRARRAYESSRLGRAARIAFAVALVGAAALVGCSHRAEAAFAAFAVSVMVGAAEWRGLDWRRGARAGLAAGLAPFLIPVASRWLSLMTHGVITCSPAPLLCFVGGLFGGAILGAEPRSQSKGLTFWGTALAVATSLGAVGCLPAGLSGLAGMAVGMAAGAVPALAARRAR
jgi:hypothetical protein